MVHGSLDKMPSDLTDSMALSLESRFQGGLSATA